MKDSFIASALIVAFILWNFCILFGIWGGSPEGCYVKIAKLEARIKILEQKPDKLKGVVTIKNVKTNLVAH